MESFFAWKQKLKRPDRSPGRENAASGSKHQLQKCEHKLTPAPERKSRQIFLDT